MLRLTLGTRKPDMKPQLDMKHIGLLLSRF